MKKKGIICVDDEKIVLNSLRDQLKTKIGNDYIIEVAETGEEALEIFDELVNESIEVPVIVSDYIMPGMKGDELLAKIHELYPRTIKILLTGQATIEGVTNAINRANLHRYISKPWEKEDLTLAITEAISSYEKDKMIEEQNKILHEQNTELLLWTGAFVEAMSTTLDTRDTTTAGHSKRLAEYAKKLAYAINEVDYGKYKDYFFDNNEINELYYAALLHDIGKIGVRENVLLKQQKLTYERELILKYKFNWLKNKLESKYYSESMSNYEKCILENIDKYLEFIIDISKKEFVSDEDIEKIKEIGSIKFIDPEGNEKNLLDEHEMKNLTVKKGNLTDEERKAINSHAENTHKILQGIPWPKDLERVPEFASSHHERLNGSGYYRGLKGDEIPLQSRILAIIDIFEALTAPDRPYKNAKSIEETLKILEKEVKLGNLDGDVFEIFVKERIYE